MPTIEMNRSNVVKVIGVIGLLLIAALILTFWAAQGTRADPVPEVKVFQAMQEEKDRLPEQLGLQSTIDPVTTRLLGERLVDEEVKHSYWGAQSLNVPGQVCIIAMFEFPQDEWISSSACNDSFHQHGVWVVTDSTAVGMEHFSLVAFIPDGYSENARRLLPEATVMDNLIIFDSKESKELTINRLGNWVITIPADETQTHNLDLQLHLQ